MLIHSERGGRNGHLPWLNYPLIEFLEGYLTPEMNIFEYGTGHSTAFFANHCKFVYGIESKPEWFDVVNGFKLKNTSVKLCQNLINFADEISSFNAKKFDVILIDSRDRIKCLHKAFEFIKPNGIIILDNVEREKLAREAHALYGEKKTHEFSGMGPSRDGESKAWVFTPHL